MAGSHHNNYKTVNYKVSIIDISLWIDNGDQTDGGAVDR